MIAARERPDIAFEVRQEFDGDGIGRLRHEVTLGHLQFVALQRPRFGEQLIARTRGEHQEIGFVPFAIETIAWPCSCRIHAHDAGTVHAATRRLRAIEQHAVENRPRIDHDGMGHFEGCLMLFAANQLHRMNQFLGVGIVQQEREALNGFVRQAAAARFFPRQVLVEQIDLVPRARQLFTAHCAGRPTADDRYLSHGCDSLRSSNSAPGRGNPVNLLLW